MPKDPKRNIQSYQIQGGHLNEFEFQKNQGEIGEESELPFTGEAEQPNLTQAEHVAAVTAEAHRKVEKRKKRGAGNPDSQRKVAARKASSKKVAGKSAKKKVAGTKTKKRKQTTAGGARSKAAGKSAKKTTKRTAVKKGSKVKRTGKKSATNR